MRRAPRRRPPRGSRRRSRAPPGRTAACLLCRSGLLRRRGRGRGTRRASCRGPRCWAAPCTSAPWYRYRPSAAVAWSAVVQGLEGTAMRLEWPSVYFASSGHRAWSRAFVLEQCSAAFHALVLSLIRFACMLLTLFSDGDRVCRCRGPEACGPAAASLHSRRRCYLRTPVCSQLVTTRSPSQCRVARCQAPRRQTRRSRVRPQVGARTIASQVRALSGMPRRIQRRMGRRRALLWHRGSAGTEGASHIDHLTRTRKLSR
jgi:hypothetical protein